MATFLRPEADKLNELSNFPNNINKVLLEGVLDFRELHALF